MERCLNKEGVWFEQQKYEQAEASYQQLIAQQHAGLRVEGKAIGATALNTEIEKAMNLIGESLKVLPSSSGAPRSRGDLDQRITALERENSQLRTTIDNLQSRLSKLEEVVNKLTGASPSTSAALLPVAKATSDDDDDDDDELDFFGSDEEEEEKRKERLKWYAEQKAKKPQVVAKSSILLDVKPWDDETDIGKMEELVRSIAQDGLLWGTSKHIPVAYGIKKLQISCVVEDDKIGTDFLEESITGFEDYVQSVDIVAFNKI